MILNILYLSLPRIQRQFFSVGVRYLFLVCANVIVSHRIPCFLITRISSNKRPSPGPQHEISAFPFPLLSKTVGLQEKPVSIATVYDDI